MLPNLSSLEWLPAAAHGMQHQALAARISALPTRCVRVRAVRDRLAAHVAMHTDTPTAHKERSLFLLEIFPSALLGEIFNQLPEPFDRHTVLKLTKKTPDVESLVTETRNQMNAAVSLGLYKKEGDVYTALHRVTDTTDLRFIRGSDYQRVSWYNGRFTIHEIAPGEIGRSVATLLGSGCMTGLREVKFKGVNGDMEMVGLYKGIGTGAMAEMRTLDLSGNYMDYDCMFAFAEALKPNDKSPMGSIANLQILELKGNNIGDAGMRAFGEAISKRSMANLTQLNLGLNNISNVGMLAIKKAISNGSMANLTDLDLSYNSIGDDGMQDFASAVDSGSLAKLTWLNLESNQIGDSGVIALSKAIGKGSMANLRVVDLDYNDISDAGMRAFLDRWREHALGRAFIRL